MNSRVKSWLSPALSEIIVSLLVINIMAGVLMQPAFAQTNQLPIANAGADQIVNEGNSVSLNGSTSSDPDGGSLLFAWQQISGPPVASLSGANTQAPSFVAPRVGSSDPAVVFRLTVTDDEGSTSADDMQVSVSNVAGYYVPNYTPTFIATSPVYYDIPDSPILRLDVFSVATWFKTSTNYSVKTMIVNKGGTGLETPGNNMNYGIWMDSAERIVGGFETSTGTDYLATSPLSYSDGQWHYAVATYNNTGGSLKLYMDGLLVATTGTGGSLPDSAGTYPLRLGTNSQGADRYFRGDIDEVRVWNTPLLSQAISDQFNYGKFDEPPASAALVYMNGVSHSRPPVASAGPDLVGVQERTIVALDGTVSSDPESEQLTFYWRQTAGPNVELLSQAYSSSPSFIAPEVGVGGASISFELMVKDPKGATSIDDLNVQLVNVNRVPVADAGSDQTVQEGTLVTLTGLASSDPDGDSLTYSWNQIAGPAVTLSAANTPSVTFNAPEVSPPGSTITIQLTVDDGNGGTVSDTVSIAVQNVNQVPDANAGTDQTVNEGALVTLSGTASSDPDSDTLSYQWNQLSGPSATLNNVNAASPTFTAPSVGSSGATLTFQLTVNDGNGGSDVDTVDVMVQNVNQAPVANAGSDQTVNEGILVSLDGTDSSDPDGDTLSYSWTQTSGPAVALSNSAASSPTFIAPTVGSSGTTLTFQLSVGDGGTPSTDTVSIIILNVNGHPVANAGSDQTVDEAKSGVTLNGGGSSDPDGEPLTYTWTQTAGPIVTLSGSNTASPSFTSPSVSSNTVLTFQLSVKDPSSAESTDTVNITVTDVSGLYNYSPSFIATGSTSFQIPDHPSLHIQQFSTAVWFKTSANYAGNAMIANKGGFGSDSSGQNMNYGIWMNSAEKLLAGFETSTGTDVFVTSVPTYNDGNWHHAVVTYDGAMIRLYVDGVQIGTKANAVGPETTGTFPLRIGANSNPNGNINYFTGEIDEIKVWNRALTPTEVSNQYNGIFGSFSIFATDGLIVYMDGTDYNATPTANAGPDQNVNEGTLVTLDATGSSDPDGDPLTSTWLQTSGPAVTLSDVNSATPSFTAPEVTSSASLSFQVTANDGNGATALDTVDITVNNVNSPPVANAGTDQVLAEGVHVMLDGTGSYDSDGGTLTYSWLQVSGLPVILSSTSSANPEFDATYILDKSTNSLNYIFELTVNDSTSSAVDTVSITINNVPGYNSNNYSPSFVAAGNNHFSTPDRSAIDLTAFSVSAWFKTSANYAGNAMIANKGGFGSDSAGQNMNYGIWMDANEKIVGGFETSTGTDVFVTSLNSYNDGNWHHAVVTYDGSVVRLYVDGVQIGTKANAVGPETTGTFPLRIGANSNPNGNINYFTGEIDEVRVQENVIQAVDINDYYNFGVKILAASLVYMDGTEDYNAPTASAGPDQTVNEASSVTLNAVASSDADGDLISYLWEQTGGTPVILTAGTYNSSMITFTAPDVSALGEILTFKLTVTDSGGLFDEDTLQVIVQDVNAPPVANAGPDQSVDERAVVILDGAASSDPDGDIMTYSWVQTTGPSVVLSNATLPVASFNAPEVSGDNVTLSFVLTVNDGVSNSMDAVNVVITNLPGYDSSYQPSFVAAGTNYFDTPDRPSLRLQQFTTSAWFKTVSSFSGNVVIVNKGGFGIDSPGQNMNYGIWMDANEKIVGGFETSTGTDIFVTSLNSYNDGNWHHAVVTYDGAMIRLYVDGVQIGTKSSAIKPDSGSTDPLRIGANSRGTNNHFIGDIDEVRTWNTPLGALEIEEYFEYGPLDSSFSAYPLVFMDGIADYNVPAASAGPDQAVLEGSAVALDGTASSDADNDPLTYSWSKVSGPNVSLTGATTATPSFVAPNIGTADNVTLTFQLIVNDGSQNSTSSDTVNIIVQKQLVQFPDFNFAAVGDFGCTDDTADVVAAIDRANPELVLGLGDYSYDSLPDCWYAAIAPIEDKMHNPTTIALGNHENAENKALRLSDAGRADLLAHFGLTESTTFHSFDYQNVHFLALDNEKPYNDGTAQYSFVKNDLLQARLNPDIDWIVVYMHKNLYGESETHPPYMTFRNVYQPLFDAYNVDLVLQGHVHNYQRTKPLEYNHTSTSNNFSSYTDPAGQIYIIAGMGGQSTQISSSHAGYILKKDVDSFGFMNIAMVEDGTKMAVKFYNTTNDILDQFTITKDITNSPPIANGGINRSVDEGDTVTLDASQSLDPEGNSLTYSWSQVDDTGYAVTLSSSTSPIVTFKAPQISAAASPVKLLFKLVVLDGDGGRSADTVTITVNDIPPLGYVYAPSFVATGSNFYGIADSASLRLSKFTVGAWFKTSTDYTENAMIANKGGFGSDSAGQNMNYGIWMDASEKISAGFEFQDGTNQFLVTPASYSDNKWHHATLTYDGTTVKLFIDGNLIVSAASATGPDTGSTSPLRIGANSRANDMYFTGNLDEVRVWNKALSATAISDMYKVGVFDPAGLVMHFDGVSRIV